MDDESAPHEARTIEPGLAGEVLWTAAVATEMVEQNGRGAFAKRRLSTATVVSAGWIRRASATSSKPTTAKSRPGRHAARRPGHAARRWRPRR